MTSTKAKIDRYPPSNVAPGIFLIDLGFQGTAGTIGAYLLAGDDELALIETGPSSTRAHLETGIREAGFDIRDVKRLIPTHIHLDHAGAAGGLMRDYPEMRITLHPGGAPFLIEPERLVKSATRIYGDRMEELWGEVAGLPADRVDTVEDGERLQVAGRSLLVRYTPGHAGTHVSILDGASGTLFTGDTAGARMAPSPYVCPTVPPPEIDLELWRESVEVMREMRPAQLALTHFGVFTDVERHLDDVIPNAEVVLAIAREELTAEHGLDDVTGRILELERDLFANESDSALLLGRMELGMPAWMASLGLQRVLKKRGELS
ncbi:MAG: MBL fold metallo-hydrolase [Thermomicrobiales bacterium]